MTPSRGRAGAFDERLARLDELGRSGAAGEPLALARAVLVHQRRRAEDPTVAAAAALLTTEARDRGNAGRYPLLALDAAAHAFAAELELAITTLLEPSPTTPVPWALTSAGGQLLSHSPQKCRELVETWLDDPTLLDPRLAFWVATAAGPALGLAAASIATPTGEEWKGPACPVCGGPPQVSVIGEASGEFLGGAPRWLVCSRCADWWSFPRATCVACGEIDAGQLVPYVAEGIPWVRIDACRTCAGYVKTFDLREEGSRPVVPLVDDVASLALDVWASSQGFARSARSAAGV